MKFRMKMALLALSAGAIALSGASCFWRALGDIVGDIWWFGAVD